MGARGHLEGAALTRSQHPRIESLRVAGLGFLLVAASLTGCLTGQEEAFSVTVASSDRELPASSQDGFVLVHVSGAETRRVVEGQEGAQAVCDVALDHTLDVANQTLAYEEERYTIDHDAVEVIVAVAVWEEYSQCPLAYGLMVDPEEPTGVDLGEPGTLGLAIGPGTSVQVEGTPVDQGQTGHVVYSFEEANEEGTRYAYTGDVRVDPLGRWPSSSLVAQ